jgi:two-component system phosphate regulon sensor histidine kinase PhoR
VKQQQKTVNFIALIVIITIGIQAYWNYIQYAKNRILVINEVQNILNNVSLDYTKKHTHKSISTNGFITKEIGGTKTDSIQNIVNNVLEELKSNNQLNPKDATEQSISYSLIQDSVNIVEFDKILKQELKNKNYELKYNLTITQNGIITDSIGQKLEAFEIITAKSKITPVESVGTINLNYANPILPSLQKGLTGIILSFLICSIVVFALYYLLQIIKKQKEISEIKNDFISNVTHEFKTPIATVSSAIEAIKNFNNEQITEKTKRYLDISEQQLKKLNILVEKVMETSLLESSELNFDYQKIDIIQLLKNCTEKHQMNTNKNIHFESSISKLTLDIDEFHFENAVSNVIDNSIKYGGNEINVSINKDNKERLSISITDNGEGISKKDEPYIFDKFYRTKTKNANNIKGFGIGLYYTKNIIEKHKGTIQLKNRNAFLITL